MSSRASSLCHNGFLCTHVAFLAMIELRAGSCMLPSPKLPTSTSDRRITNFSVQGEWVNGITRGNAAKVRIKCCLSSSIVVIGVREHLKQNPAHLSCTFTTHCVTFKFGKANVVTAVESLAYVRRRRSKSRPVLSL